MAWLISLVEVGAGAMAWKHPHLNGLLIEFEKVVRDQKVMQALHQVEEGIPHAGSSMLAAFFPGPLREDEDTRWSEYRRTAKDRAATKLSQNATSSYFVLG